MAVVASMVGLLWRRLRRDPVGLAFTVLVPVAVAVVLGAIYMSEDEAPAGLGLVVEGDGPVSADLAARLEASPVLDVTRYADRAGLDRAVRAREVDAGVVVPADADSLDRTSVSRVELVGAPGVSAPGGLRAVVEQATEATAAAVQLAHALSPDDPLGSGLAQAQDRLDTGTAAEDHDRGEARRDAATRAVLATLVLFVFTNTLGASSSWAEARELGVTARLRTTPASPTAVAAGFGLALASYAAVQGLLVVAVGAALYDMPITAPLPFMATVTATVLAAGGLGLLVATVLPSGASGTTIAGPAGFVLGMLGGCLWPLEIAPPALRAIGRATPTYWAVDGLQTAGINGARASDIAAGTALLVALALVLGALGLARMTRRAV